MTAAVDVRGLKRACTNCGTRFYDMNKRPIICPSCGTEFTGAEKPKPRGKAASAVAAAAETAKPEAQEAVEVVETNDNEVSLDDAEDTKSAELDEGQIDMDGDMEELDDINVDTLDDETLDDLDTVDEDLED